MQKCCDECIAMDPVFNDKCQAGCYQKVFSNDYFWAWLYRKWKPKPEVENKKLFLYKSINVYWPNGLAPTQYTDFDFYSSTSGNYTNWFGSEIFCFIFWLANENTRIGKKYFRAISLVNYLLSGVILCLAFIFVRNLWYRHRRFRRLGVSFQDQPWS